MHALMKWVAAVVITGWAVYIGYKVEMLEKDGKKTREDVRGRQRSEEEVLKHNAASDRWRLIVDEDRALTDEEQVAYRNFVALEMAIHYARQSGNGDRWSFEDLAKAADLRESLVADAKRMIVELEDICARRDQDERGASRKDGPRRDAANKKAATIGAYLLETGEINMEREFREMYFRWRDSPANAPVVAGTIH